MLDLPLPQPQVAVALDHSERSLGRGKEDGVASLAEPHRATGAACEKEGVRLTLVDPGGRHGAAEVLERARVVPGMGGDREDRLRVHAHPRLGAGAGVGGEQLVVVRDDPVVDADDRPVPNGMVVGVDRGVALGVVAHVHQQLRHILGHRDPLEELRGGRALLDDGGVFLGSRAVGVPDGVGPSLGDGGEQCLRSQRPLDIRA